VEKTKNRTLGEKKSRFATNLLKANIAGEKCKLIVKDG